MGDKTAHYLMGDPSHDNPRADAISKPLIWRYAYEKENPNYSKENDKLWEILNELDENKRILDNKNAFLNAQQQEQQQRMFAIARNAESPSKVNTFSGVFGSPSKSEIAKRLRFDSTNKGGKSRRVFRKKTKTTRRRNKKSNRRRRTSHVAKQT
jgi:hypothetical protein